MICICINNNPTALSPAVDLVRPRLERLDHLLGDLGEDGLRRNAVQRVGEGEDQVDAQDRRLRASGREAPCRDEVLEQGGRLGRRGLDVSSGGGTAAAAVSCLSNPASLSLSSGVS